MRAKLAGLFASLAKAQESKRTEALDCLINNRKQKIEEDRLRNVEEDSKFRLKKRSIQGLYKRQCASLAQAYYKLKEHNRQINNFS
jgi:hypothetical protein